MVDACGLAGGTPWGFNAPEEGNYKNTTYAHHGMRGTDLAPLETGVQWSIGGEAEVTWQVRNNHGGGYQWRLCALDEFVADRLRRCGGGSGRQPRHCRDKRLAGTWNHSGLLYNRC